MNTTLSWTIECIDLAARAAGYPSALEALIDLTTEPTVAWETTWVELLRGEGEAESWRAMGMSLSHDTRNPRNRGRTNAEVNEGRAKDARLVEALRAYRAAGLTAAEQAAVLNHQQGRDYWTAARIWRVAHQAGLTATPANRGRGGYPGDVPVDTLARRASTSRARAAAKRAAEGRTGPRKRVAQPKTGAERQAAYRAKGAR